MMSEHSTLSCAELVELVTRYFDGALEPAERRRFDKHVASCDGCARHLEQMRSTIATVGSLTEDDLPATALADLLEAFRRWGRPR